MFGGKARLGGLGGVLRDSECSGKRVLMLEARRNTKEKFYGCRETGREGSWC